MTDNVAKNQSLSNNQSSQSETESKIQPNLPTQPPAIIRTLPLILLTVAFGIYGDLPLESLLRLWGLLF